MPGGPWDGMPTMSIQCRLETEADSYQEAIQKWAASFTEEQKALIDLNTFRVFDIDVDLQSHIPYYKEGRVLFTDGRSLKDRETAIKNKVTK